MRRLQLVLAAAAVAGCADVFGLDEVTRGEDAATTGMTTTTTSASTGGDGGATGSQGGAGGAGGAGANGGGGDGAGGEGDGGGGHGAGLAGCTLPWDEATPEVLAETDFLLDDEDWFIDGGGSFACGQPDCTVTTTQSIVSFGRGVTSPANLPGSACVSFALDASSEASVLVAGKLFDNLGAVVATEQFTLAEAADRPTSWTCALPGDVSTDIVGFTFVGPAGGYQVDVASASVRLVDDCEGAPPCERPQIACIGAGSIDVEGDPPRDFEPADAADWAEIPHASCEATRIVPTDAGLSVTHPVPALTGACIQPAVMARGNLDLELWLRDERSSDTIRFAFPVDDPLWSLWRDEPCSLPEGFVPVAVELITSPDGPTCAFVDLDRIDLQTPLAPDCARTCDVDGS